MRFASRFLASAGALALAVHPAFAAPPAASPSSPTLPIGTMAGTAAAGNDSRITGAVQQGGAADALTVTPPGVPGPTTFNAYLSQAINLKTMILSGDADATAGFSRAVSQALLSATPVEIYIPCGTYNKTGAQSITTSGGQGVYLHGASSACVNINQNDDNDAFDVSLTNYGGAMSTGAFAASGFSLKMAASGSSTARNGIYVSSTAATGTFGFPTYLSDIKFSSVSSTAYWGNEINIGPLPNIVDISHINAIYTGGGLGTHIAVAGNSSAYTTSVYGRDITLVGGQTGVVLGNYLQGIHFSNLNTLNTIYSVYSTPNNAGVQQEYNIANSSLAGKLVIAATSPGTVSAVNIHDTYIDNGGKLLNGDTHVSLANVGILTLHHNTYNGPTSLQNGIGLAISGALSSESTVDTQKLSGYSGTGTVPWNVSNTTYPIIFDNNQMVNSNAPVDTATTPTFRNFYTNTQINGTFYSVGGPYNGFAAFGGAVGSGLTYEQFQGPDTNVGKVYIAKGLPGIAAQWQDGLQHNIVQYRDSGTGSASNGFQLRAGASGVSPQLVGAGTGGVSSIAAGASGGLAPTATTGFFQVPYCTGAPTATPSSSATAFASECYDTASQQLWHYDPVAAKWVPSNIFKNGMTSNGESAFTAAEDHAISTVTASFTFDATMQMRVADATSAAVVGTLPACGAATNGRQYTLAKADSTANAVSFAPNGTDKITGTNANLPVGSSVGSSITLQCNGNASGVTAGWWRR